MATLVLSTVGQMVGGPIGGAVGAILGQAIDGRLFRGAAREGPRLTELAVQTSSYGTALPKIFGTMRVAGTVIWSTDLIETRSSQRGGKGQPGTNSYAYSASFAVALSARPILAVRRIWAEGKLLRGAAGDWKSQTGFRLHLGSEDQPVDPLIASAMGTTPAYRGIAYAVFEGMQLGAFGNRIPSLTFELVADAAAVGCGAIAAALAPEVVAGGGLALDGFAASGASVRGVLDTLAMLDSGWWRTAGAQLVRQGDSGTALLVADAGMAASGRTARRRQTVAALASVPREVAVAHHDPARDYQIGVQRVRRPGAGERIDRVELPAVVAAATAKGVAAALVARGEVERTRREVVLGVEGLGIAPGAIVALADEAGRWRVAASSVSGMMTTLTLVPLGAMPAVASASSGRVAAAPDRPIGRTWLIAAELPGLGEVPLSAPRVSVFATGEGAGWRQAALLYSLDDGASWTAAGATAAPATIGRIEIPPAAASALLTDRRSRMVVVLRRGDMTLGDADATSLARGDNLALLGDELIQFERAAPLGEGRWALTGLYRGLRGTEAAIGTQAAGDRFVLIEPGAVATIDLPVAAIGRRLRLLASGVGDADGPAETTVAITGASVAPPAPVHAVAETQGDGGLAIRWTRRSRAGWAWSDGVDAPLVEEAEAYRLTVTAADGTRRVVETAAPYLRFAAGERPPAGTTIAIVQQGTLVASQPARISLSDGG
ncbi:phage tail protein [Sphingomonas sp. M6A6_1c]